MAADERKDHLTKMLVAKRNELVKSNAADLKRSFSGEDRIVMDTCDDGDLATLEEHDEMVSKRLNARRAQIRGIDGALLRIKEGIYGICAECGEGIEERRLAAMPFAPLCHDCQEVKESEESRKTGASGRYRSKENRHSQ
jgi:DnaK suppressor protein